MNDYMKIYGNLIRLKCKQVEKHKMVPCNTALFYVPMGTGRTATTQELVSMQMKVQRFEAATYGATIFSNYFEL